MYPLDDVIHTYPLLIILQHNVKRQPLQNDIIFAPLKNVSDIPNSSHTLTAIILLRKTDRRLKNKRLKTSCWSKLNGGSSTYRHTNAAV